MSAISNFLSTRFLNIYVSFQFTEKDFIKTTIHGNLFFRKKTSSQHNFQSHDKLRIKEGLYCVYFLHELSATFTACNSQPPCH